MLDPKLLRSNLQGVAAELARKARERMPNLAVLFTSGYTQNSIVHSGRLDESVELLSKPYSREALARKLRHMLRTSAQRKAVIGAAIYPGPTAAPVETSQWPSPPSESYQRDWASSWVALATAKPFVRSVTWRHATDAGAQLFPNSGLFRADGSPKPVVEWLTNFREAYLS